MKKETLQKRIEDKLYTKSGKLQKKYEDVITILLHPERKFRPCCWTNKGRSLRDYRMNVTEGLRLISIDFESGNDAPRGGLNGNYIVLTSKGKRQSKEYREGYENR